ncbi:MAG: DUF1080 domain-containing protein [Microscillaceae bacterium]|nr:DUF1080 domain-containing protein [Microscillaceae bacterium]
MMKYLHLLLVLLLGMSVRFVKAQEIDAGWESLFNGKDLSDWTQRNGKAEYRVDNQEIVGITKLNTPNSFLCTQENYSNFILEFEVKVEGDLNTGVQIRSLSKEDYQNGRVHGYQVEIDPSERAFSGGLYDEARRLWLYPLSRNPKARKAFKKDEWNSFHIEAIGSEIRTWVNGIQCTNLIDDLTKEGFIALQVHSIGDASQENKEIRWRNLMIKTQNLENARWKPDPEVPEISYLTNQLTANEKKQGWKLLWDGKTTKGWKSAKSDNFPEKGWIIKDGVLIVEKSQGGESANGGDIITTKSYSNFELEIDFKITEGANSGIKYFVNPDLNKTEGSTIGLEYQLLDDKKHPDAQAGRDGNRTIASLYDLIPAGNLSVPGRSKQFKGVGVWNRARIVVNGTHVEHWLNDEKTLEYERGSQEYRDLVAKSKYAKWPNFGELPAGPILLQDHGDEVHFRNIKIKELKK